MRLVIDTNVLVAALIRKNTAPYQLYKAWREGIYELITSEAQLDELKRVLGYSKLRRYFSQDEAHEMVIGMAVYSSRAVNLPVVTYSPDPDDNLILATAIAGKAHYIVRGDKGDMLVLGTVENIPIVTARRAVEIVEAGGDFD